MGPVGTDGIHLDCAADCIAAMGDHEYGIEVATSRSIALSHRFHQSVKSGCGGTLVHLSVRLLPSLGDQVAIRRAQSLNGEGSIGRKPPGPPSLSRSSP
jgi:hypothetical protein